MIPMYEFQVVLRLHGFTAYDEGDDFLVLRCERCGNEWVFSQIGPEREILLAAARVHEESGCFAGLELTTTAGAG